jgi:hypothetical protein
MAYPEDIKQSKRSDEDAANSSGEFSVPEDLNSIFAGVPPPPKKSDLSLYSSSLHLT